MATYVISLIPSWQVDEKYAEMEVKYGKKLEDLKEADTGPEKLAERLTRVAKL